MVRTVRRRGKLIMRLPGRMVLGAAAFAGAVLLSGCETTKLAATAATGPDMALETGCVGDRPLDARLEQINEQLQRAFASAPPLSLAEYEQMRRLGSCTGGAVLGVTDGCRDEWAQAKASGLADRSRIRGAQYSIPIFFERAKAATVRSQRIRYLATAHAIAWQAHEYNEVRFARGEISEDVHGETSVALFGAEGLIQETLACESLR